MNTELTVSRATLEEWRQVEEWAADEAWNPGRGDTACFHPTDPDGFFLGRLGGRPVSAVSVVTYSDRFAFLGYYLVDPEHRGRGLGMATWRTALPHAGERTIGLDAVPAQEAIYRRSGFTSAYRTVRCAGTPPRTDGAAPKAPVQPVTPDDLDALAAYDRQCFPADRRAFLGRWLTAEGHTAYVSRQDGRVTGYGVIRSARDGQRVGPLFADSPAVAEALFDTLTGHLDGGEEVYLDIPEPHEHAQTLAASRGLEPRSHTVRMYTGPVPPTGTDRTYGITSLELG
ncbi:GNAT family N-acetyltransferase [Streptomyces armeniacus]|uniref:GNAT family N-acetyltransferase n=1 Tax=Streptomyces armeniacus TaxID=83291 RepID=A0A345XR05_9ACTN|nr:GNAT family N-acetyltransferase [Streptomyces armeniacus]AXK34071.1 GNAT family N-acetyltransferase [Streptomyces armeniacus]